jgi:methionyl-tRNA formyltransferase
VRIIFAGTSEFAISALQVLLNSHHDICAVYTKQDRPAGRGQKLTASPIKEFVLANNLDLRIYQPESLKDAVVQEKLKEFSADVFINVAYGLIIPDVILNMFKFGCVNIHPSLLPRWRGAAPIQRAIMAEDAITGVSIMRMDSGVDTGDIYKQEKLSIDITDTSASLFLKTAELGAKLLLEVLTEIANGTAKATAQNNIYSTYAKKIAKEEGKINWHKNSSEIDCMIRAFNPWPIAYSELDGQVIRIWQATKTKKNENTEPGVIIQADKNGIIVATGDGAICLLKIQLSGGKPLLVADILNAHHKTFASGKKFEF